MTVLADSADAGLCLVEDRENRAVYMFNHLEYDAGTLRDEFLRDRSAGKPTGIPVNYFPRTIPRARRRMSGGPSPISCSATGLERSSGRRRPREIGKPLSDDVLA